MALFPSGFNPNVVDTAAIAAAMRPALYLWFGAMIRVVDPSSTTGERYNAKTDSGGVAEYEVLFTSPALIQPIGGARSIEQADQATALLGIRIQCEIERVPETVRLRSGLQVIVTDAGEDKTLERFAYALKKPVDSSMAWGKILEATVIVGGRS